MSKKIIPLCFALLLSGCSHKREKQAKIVQTNLVQNISTTTEQITDDTKVIDQKNCSATPEVYSNVQMPAIYKTNNLRRKTGYATYASGQFIRINGVVTDIHCVPIMNATVQIWHADSNGLYKDNENGYLNDAMMYGKQEDRFEKKYQTKGDPYFTGSGSTVTDNLGRFSFLSIMPGKSHAMVNFRVLHKDFDELNSIMYFDDKLQKSSLLIAEKQDTENKNETIYFHKLTFKDKNKYLRY